ncbi:MAG TPA: hypothetical protein VE684_01185 [Crenalkalicoccus sp.]|jgi:hypothetical protein|nr:hypothetical protein [Crenalkalicoccus sp.]
MLPGTPPARSPTRPPLSAPFTWAGGSLLLTLTLSLTGVIALVRACIELFD